MQFRYRYPSSGGAYTGVALYSARTRANLDAGTNLTRTDLGLLPADGQGIVTTMVAGFDDTRDYFVALRTYDAVGNESRNSEVGVIPATAAPDPRLLFSDDFEATEVGVHPDAWVDSSPDTNAASARDLFTVVGLSDGSHALAAPAANGEIQASADVAGSAGWSSYELSGRIWSTTLSGVAGVSALSRYPAATGEYLLTRTGAAAYALAKRGPGSLTCVGSASTRVAPVAGRWQRFKLRVTRFDGRNRLRAAVWADGAAEPNWQADCWDTDAENLDSGSVGVVSAGVVGNHWDDIRVKAVDADGAPPGYGTPPPASGGSGGSSGGSGGSGSSGGSSGGTGGSSGGSSGSSGGAGGSSGGSGGSSGGTGGSSGGSSGSGGSGGGASGYTSGTALAHWWRPGWDTSDLGRDFAAGGGIDAFVNQTGLKPTDLVSAGSTASEVDLDGKKEALGNFKLAPYGVGDSWSLAAWVRPVKLPKKAKKPVYVFDLNGARSKKSVSRISLMLDSTGHFAVAVSDAQGRERAISSSSTASASQLGTGWYHVVAVKTASASLSLYVNGTLVATTTVAVPTQSDVPRALRIGGRVKSSKGYYFNGGIASVALWRAPLGASEIAALYASGNRAGDLRTTILTSR